MAKSQYKKKKYSYKYACGHQGTVYIGGYTEEYREERAKEIFSEECPSCRHKKEYENALKKSKKRELPDLQGSEKQINWATSLRIRKLEELDDYINKQEDPMILEVYQRLLSKTSSEFWIDNRAKEAITILAIVKNEILDENISMEEQYDLEMEAEILKEQTVIPNNYNDKLVRIKVKSKTIFLISDKDDVFISLVKNMGFRWIDSVWQRTIYAYDDNFDDILIGVGSQLLNSGFGLRLYIYNYSIYADKMKKADYTPEHTRKILYGAKYKAFLIKWFALNDEIYSGAMNIKDAKYSKSLSGVLVPVENFKEVDDFGNSYDFYISKPVQKVIDILKDAELNSVEIAKAKKSEYANKLEEILERNAEIESDLIDI